MSAAEHPPLCGIWVELDDISGDHPIGDCDCGIDGPRNEGWHGPKSTCPDPYCKDGWVDYDPFTPAERCRHPECPALSSEDATRPTPAPKVVGGTGIHSPSEVGAVLRRDATRPTGDKE